MCLFSYRSYFGDTIGCPVGRPARKIRSTGIVHERIPFVLTPEYYGFIMISFLLIVYLKLPVSLRASMTCCRLSSSNTPLYCVLFSFPSVIRTLTLYQCSIFNATFSRLSPSKASLFFTHSTSVATVSLFW